MSASLVYLLLRQVLQMLTQLARDDGAKDVELLVLREGCHLSVAVVSSEDGVGRLSVMVVRTLAFVVVRRVLGLVGLVRRRMPRTSRSPCCGIS